MQEDQNEKDALKCTEVHAFFSLEKDHVSRYWSSSLLVLNWRIAFLKLHFEGENLTLFAHSEIFQVFEYFFMKRLLTLKYLLVCPLLQIWRFSTKYFASVQSRLRRAAEKNPLFMGLVSQEYKNTGL